MTGQDESTQSSDERLLIALLDKYEEAVGRGEEPDIDALCASHARVGSELRAVLGLWARLDGSSQQQAPVAPSRLGPYRVLEELGRGGMASVYRAIDTRLERQVALKVLVADSVTDAARRQRFVREAKALARGSHPNVVSIIDVGEDRDAAWLAMPLMPGSLAGFAMNPDDRKASTRRAVTAVLEAATGVAHAHRSGMVHRDIKPSNLLLDDEGRVRVADFGLARMEGQAALTRDGQAMGTVGFASPEQLGGDAVDARSDVYGLGATLWALLLGRTPPLPTGTGISDLLPSTVPAALAHIIRRATALDPNRRHIDASDLADDLRAWLAGRYAAPEAAWRRVLSLVVVLLMCALGAALLSYRSATADPAPLASGYLKGRRSLSDTPRFGSLRFWEVLARPGRDRLELTTAGRPSVVSLNDGGTVTMSVDGKERARMTLPRSASGAWTLGGDYDADGDGSPEIVVRNAIEYAYLKWEPRAWPEEGWRSRVDGRFSHGSPTLADWDGDGDDELLVGVMRPSGGSALSVWRIRDGTMLRTLPLSGEIRSTPRVVEGVDERLAVYVDSEPTFGGTDAFLYRIVPGEAPVERRFPLASPLTWPVFQDVDVDGRDEVLVGVVADELDPDIDRPGAIYCLPASLEGEPLWVYRPRSPGTSYLLLSDQDRDGVDDLCFGTESGFECLRTGVDVASTERVLWQVDWPPIERILHSAVEIGDYTGDGIPELAGGTTSGRVVVMSVEHAPDLLWSVRQPGVGAGNDDASDIVGRLAVVEDPSGSRVLVAATMAGEILALPLPVTDGGWSWRYTVEGAVVASPQVVRRRGDAGGTEPEVLVASYDGALRMLPTSPATGYRSPSWGYWSEGGIGATPAITERDGRTWLYFTDFLGYIYGVPLSAESD